MGKKRSYTARLPEDVATEVERYREENNLSKADALRRAAEHYYLDRDLPAPKPKARFFERVVPLLVVGFVAGMVASVMLSVETALSPMFAGTVVGVIVMVSGVDQVLDRELAGLLSRLGGVN